MKQREMQVIQLVYEGKTDREIANHTGYSFYYVKNKIRELADRLGFKELYHPRIGLAIFYVLWRWYESTDKDYSQGSD